MTRTIKELRNDVKEGRQVRQKIISKYGFVPESILKINYQKNNMLKQMVTTQNEKSKEYHKDKYYASEPDLLKALGASSKSVRGEQEMYKMTYALPKITWWYRMSEIDGLVAFSILMENNNGILGKAPSYIFEKYEFCTKMEHPENMLDSTNKAKFNKYMETWFRQED